MLSQAQATHILRSLQALPSTQVAQVEDFIKFLTVRYDQQAEEDDRTYWTEEDLEDITRAAMSYAE